MIRGYIKAKHIILHPIMLIGTLGLLGYFRLIVGCFDSSNRCFTDFLMK